MQRPSPIRDSRTQVKHTGHSSRIRADSCEALEERVMFFRKFLSAPLKTGSILPSSESLTREMVKPLDWPRVNHVAELGAGTGVFTRRIGQLHRPGTGVMVFEKDDPMRQRLQDQFPAFSFHPDALDIRQVLAQREIPALDGIISGLPFSNFPPSLRHAILDEAAAALAPDGVFVTFIYSLRLLDTLKQRFRSVRTTLVPLNFPPAFVHVCRGPMVKRG